MSSSELEAVPSSELSVDPADDLDDVIADATTTVPLVHLEQITFGQHTKPENGTTRVMISTLWIAQIDRAIQSTSNGRKLSERIRTVFQTTLIQELQSSGIELTRVTGVTINEPPEYQWVKIVTPGETSLDFETTGNAIGKAWLKTCETVAADDRDGVLNELLIRHQRTLVPITIETQNGTRRNMPRLQSLIHDASTISRRSDLYQSIEEGDAAGHGLSPLRHSPFSARRSNTN